MSRKSTKRNLSRAGILLGGYVPKPLAGAIEEWVSARPERDKSTFLREAAREKLRNEGIVFNEREEVVP